ncbi:MAG: hypothetical protein J6V00_07765 [Bacteroidaceae bacterium]|nr:hypothetical protein [Bacteroidaceae bacterium]
MIHEEICTYEVCKLAKEKGFDVPTHYAYNENCQKAMYMELCLNRNTKDSHSISAPTQSLLQRWLREEKGYYVYPFFDDVQLKWDWVCKEKTGEWIPLIGHDFHLFATYELALEDALKYALEKLV